MTREEAEQILADAGDALDSKFPLLHAAVACAIHDYPFRDPAPAYALAEAAASSLSERLARDESPDEALAETLSGELRLNGDLLTFDDPANTDVLDVADRRRGISATLGVFYLHAARRAGLRADGVDFPNHFLLRVETEEGPVAIDPFSQGRLVLPSELSRRALRAGLTPDVADRLEALMAPVSDRQVLIRLQNTLFARALNARDYEAAERSAVRRALLDPNDHRPWLDVAAAREKQGALTGALEALNKAQQLDGGAAVAARAVRDRVRMRLN
ncbi:MAG TPA: transglutaminase family protein [Caulobacteraceae bacterium]|nr:transglutaminase family protein [Caulobacteraceae bacterium]